MLIEQVVREAPVANPLVPTPLGSEAPTQEEPLLRMDRIQGNIVGFNKDHQTLLFLQILNPAAFRGWLAPWVTFIASAEEVLAFNRLFKAVRHRRKAETRTVQATWLNVAFSYDALRRLTEGTDLALTDDRDFADEAFRQGMAVRSTLLGDPTGAAAEGHPSTWVVGGPDTPADVVLIVASDDPTDLDAEVARIEDAIYAPRTPDGKPARSGARVVFKQRGATLPPPLTGHEHFGFLDGVSQPGLRGRVSSENPDDFLTARQNPKDRDQGKPGQDLLWPGEFVFGYAGQDPNAQEVSERGPVSSAGPSWADDGSFLVFRRLRQDVAGFERFVRQQSATAHLTEDHLGAKLVGRWDSGAPILRATTQDNTRLAADDCANNHFEFQGESERIRRGDRETDVDCADDFHPSAGDKEGRLCPFAGHIRKTYPRDDVADTPYGAAQSGLPNEVETQTHRLLRRGIPFGEPFHRAREPHAPDSGDRGLLFLAYQTSIVEQFEFVTRSWVNTPDFKEPGSGFDPILGQNNAEGANRRRTFRVTFADREGTVQTRELETTEDWVIPTGGGYFFAPSISALGRLSGGPDTGVEN